MEGTVMAERRNRYRQLDQYMTMALIADVVLFILYMIFAGNGITWLKVFIAVLCFIISGGAIAVLVMTQEVLRPRSIWMTVTAGAVVLVLLFSLILNFPSPNPRKQPVPGPVSDTAAAMVWEESAL